MRGRNWKGWWDGQATPCFLPTSLLGTGWEVTGATDPNPNLGGLYRRLLNQAHNTCQFPGWCINAWATQAAAPILPQGLKAAGLEICAAVGETELGGAYGKGRGEEVPQEQAALTYPLPGIGYRGSLLFASPACAASSRPRTVGSTEGAAHHQWPDFYETLFGF